MSRGASCRTGDDDTFPGVLWRDHHVFVCPPNSLICLQSIARVTEYHPAAPPELNAASLAFQDSLG